jgi:hypothetical protein
MRTTITLDPEVYSMVRRLMQERGLGFKDAVNAAIRAGLAPRKRGAPFRTRAFDMGEPTTSLDKALQLAGALEDDEIRRELALRR